MRQNPWQELGEEVQGDGILKSTAGLYDKRVFAQLRLLRVKKAGRSAAVKKMRIRATRNRARCL